MPKLTIPILPDRLWCHLEFYPDLDAKLLELTKTALSGWGPFLGGLYTSQTEFSTMSVTVQGDHGTDKRGLSIKVDCSCVAAGRFLASHMVSAFAAEPSLWFLRCTFSPTSTFPEPNDVPPQN